MFLLPPRLPTLTLSRPDDSELTPHRFGAFMKIETIAVIGAGTMGRGIAYAAAYGGYRTILEDVSAPMLDQGAAWIRQAFEEGVARGKVTPQQRDRALANLSV